MIVVSSHMTVCIPPSLSRLYRVCSNASTHRDLLRLMKVPMDSFEDPLTLLKLDHVTGVFGLFDYTGRKLLATHLVQAIVNKRVYIRTAEAVSDHVT